MAFTVRPAKREMPAGNVAVKDCASGGNTAATFPSTKSGATERPAQLSGLVTSVSAPAPVHVIVVTGAG